MEAGFDLEWGDTVVQEEEVICGIQHETILSDDGPPFGDVCSEVVVRESPSGEPATGTTSASEDVTYIDHDHHDGILVMDHEGSEPETTPPFMDCSVGEEVVPDQWACTQEIIVGGEENVIGDDVQEDVSIPLPLDQDQYTAARPYPCDFCSRRFRKKANLMNHMVSHQTDRPHGCNLCGVRYIRKCDLMNHLKIHAYVPETMETIDEDTPDESDYEKQKRPKPFIKKRKKPKIKEEIEDSPELKGASSSRTYDYVDEDVRLMEAMEANVKPDYVGFYRSRENRSVPVEPRYPISDPKKPFVCQHCGVGFAREKALASHSRVHAGDSPFECEKCGEMFWDAALMREHIRDKHGNIDETFDEEDDEYSEDEGKYGEYFCQTCGMTFHRLDLLRRHQKIHVKEEYVNDVEFGHICKICGEVFTEALDLLAHAEIHTRNTAHRCMLCGELAASEQEVAIHVQSKHGKTLPPNTCLQCGRTCKDKKTLLKHSFEHTKEKVFTCDKCPKTFHNRPRLRRHMLSHRNKIVNCDVCGKEFPDGRSLMNHRHSHSSVSGRQFPCKECGKTFGSRSSQQIHLRIHTGERPYGCRYCWKAFADGGTLRKHERIHTGEKPYACAVCPRAFNQRVVLREHIRSHHSGPDPTCSHTMTPYCCSVCSDMFATSQDLIVHLIHHCDLNTAMRRAPQIGPRKYKRRRKLKPHELLIVPNSIPEDENNEDDDDEDEFTDTDEENNRRHQKGKKKNAGLAGGSNNDPTNSFPTATTVMENVSVGPVGSLGSGGTSKPSKKKSSRGAAEVPSRPKMIHTQKTKVAVETTEGGKVRHKTRTLVTRTQPAELRSAVAERIRPRTKNVSYHVLNPDKYPLATFDDATEAVNNLLASEDHNGLGHVQEAAAAGVSRRNNSLEPGRVIIGPGTKVVRIVKGGMIVKSKGGGGPSANADDCNARSEPEPEQITPDLDDDAPALLARVKQEVADTSPLHELAELSMRHARSMFKCEMCSEVFADRAQLLVHVPVHI